MFFKRIKTLPLFIFVASMRFVLFVRVKSFCKKRSLKLPWWLHLYYYWIKSYFCYPSKNLPAIFADSKQSKTPFEKNCDLWDTMPRHWSLCFLFRHITYRTPCHSSGYLVILPRVLRIWGSVFYSQAFFTLHSFLLVLRPLRRRQFNLKFTRASCWFLKHSPGPTICLNHNNPQKEL